MRKPVVLITGAAGEIGHALVARLAHGPDREIVTVDLQDLQGDCAELVARAYCGSILDPALLDAIQAEFKVERIFHLAALLSTRSEFTPVTAHEVNVRGTLNLLELAVSQSRSHGEPVVFFYPSSIAAYGVPGPIGRPLLEGEHTQPITMYGCNKLYCEHLGRYYSRHYKQLDAEVQAGRVDFRALRFPGLISALTVPSGGTSDYAPEMIHAAAQCKPYVCFVRPDTQIPFMAMPDAIDAILALTEAPREQLTRQVYNLSSFNPTAAQIGQLVTDAFADAAISYEPDLKRQAIVDSWPRSVDDRAARADWGLQPAFDLQRAFDEYLIPTIARRYGGRGNQ